MEIPAQNVDRFDVDCYNTGRSRVQFSAERAALGARETAGRDTGTDTCGTDTDATPAGAAEGGEPGAADPSDPTGERFTAVAKVGLTWLVEPSPSGRYLALWGPNQKGNYTLVDLKTGEVQTRTGPFQRCVQDGGVTFAWSPDERYLAGTDCDNDATGEGARTLIIDPFSGEAVRTLEGKYVVAWLPDGRFLTLKQPGLPSASMLVLDPEGTVLAEMDGYARSSPDGRFLLQVMNTGVDTQFLMNVATGERMPLNLPGTLLWTNGNVIYETR